jgi:hypothetical protein
VKLVDDSSIVSTTEVDNYLNSDFLPFVWSMYVGIAKALTSFEEFFNLLLQAIIKCGYKKDKVRTILIHFGNVEIKMRKYCFVTFRTQSHTQSQRIIVGRC